MTGDPLHLEASCAPVVGKGRIRCTLAVESTHAIRWAEIVVRESPSFADPLRGRVGPLEASLRTNRSWKWEFAFAGLKKGEGETLIEVRAVTCEGERCLPQTASLRVGLRVD